MLRAHSIVMLGLAFTLTTTSTARAQCTEPASGGDIIGSELFAVGNYASTGALEALSFGTTPCNIGDTPIDVSVSSPDTFLLTQNLYRLQDKGGWFAMEQVGMSWARYEVCALNVSVCCTCVPTDCTSLGAGCSYSTSANLNAPQMGMGPRWQIDATTATFPNPPADPPFAGTTARRLEVAIADLEPTASTPTRYFGEIHFLSPDDAAPGNGHNNVSWRELGVSGSGSAWSFGPLLGLTKRETPAIYAWTQHDPGVDVRAVDLPLGGRTYVASRVTDLGAGQWHYEYALYNMNSHDALRSFSIPVPAGVSVTSIGFHDVTYRNGDGLDSVDFDGDDWPGVRAGGSLTWETDTFTSNTNANALRWGTTYNFRFDADAPPAYADLTLVRYRSDAVHVVPLGVPVPLGGHASFCDASDGALASCPCANPGAADTGCDIPQGTGGVSLSVLAQSTSPNGATLQGTGFPTLASPTVIVIRSNALDPAAPVVFGDGLRCINNSPLVRLAAASAALGVSTHVFGHGAMAGVGTFHYQVWFRSTPSTFCDPAAAFNLSNGRTLTW